MTRMILSLLAIANLRWARADLDRSERLYAEGDTAYAQSNRRLALADSLVQRSRCLAR